jgi:hypothetical protein
MKTDDVIVCSELNEYIWNKGAKNPPGKVSVTALKTEIGGKLKTIVNLSSVGLDKQVELYKSQSPSTETKEAVTDVKAKEVKETVKKAEEKVEEKSSDVKETKEDKKTETKKEDTETSSVKSETKKEEVKNG